MVAEPDGTPVVKVVQAVMLPVPPIVQLTPPLLLLGALAPAVPVTTAVKMMSVPGDVPPVELKVTVG